ncbi:CMRF35-like molecule 3 [Spinachia spinachia]
MEVLHACLLPPTVARVFVMKTSLGLLNAPLLCVLWLTKHAVASVALSAAQAVTGAYGGSVAIPCRYDGRFRDNRKYWCKGLLYDLCVRVAETPSRRPEERASVADDKEAGVFTVTMSSLGEADGGKYWCVIDVPGRDIHTGVDLYVSHAVMTTPATLPQPDVVSYDESQPCSQTGTTTREGEDTKSRNGLMGLEGPGSGRCH